MRFVRSTVAIAIAAAGVLAVAPSPASAGYLIADFRCDRGAGTYVCEVRLPWIPAAGPLVSPTSAAISWYVEGVSQPSFDQSRFLTGSCIAGSVVTVEVSVRDPANNTDITRDPWEEPEFDTNWRAARFRCLHIEPPDQVPTPVHGG
jgi:hypothetical protein